jgi:hypothetical protein
MEARVSAFTDHVATVTANAVLASSGARVVTLRTRPRGRIDCEAATLTSHRADGHSDEVLLAGSLAASASPAWLRLVANFTTTWSMRRPAGLRGAGQRGGLGRVLGRRRPRRRR